MVTKREMIRLLRLISQRLTRDGKLEAADEFNTLLARLSVSTLDKLVRAEGGRSIAMFEKGEE